MTAEEIKKKIALGDKRMAKKFGDTYVKGTDVDKVSFYPTGISSIDNALGGGWAVGRLCSIYGEFSSGKTTFLTQCIANTQKNDPRFCMFVDAEATFDPEYAERLGVDLDRLRVIQADDAEKVCTIIRNTCTPKDENGDDNPLFGCFSLIILDSTNMLVPSADMKKEVNRTGGTMGGVAGLLSQFTKQMAGPLRKSGTTLICIEQTRETMDPYSPIKIGNGKAVGFAATQRLELRKADSIKIEGDEWGGQKIKFKVVKNKAATPNKKGITTITAGKGFDAEADDALFVIESGIIKRLNNVKWAYTTKDGEVIEIKGQKNIITTLKEKGVYEEAVKAAKNYVANRAENGPKGSEEYDTNEACGEEGANDKAFDEVEPEV